MRRGGRRGIRGSSRREVDGIEPSFLFSSRRTRIRNKSIVARHLPLSSLSLYASLMTEQQQQK